MKHGIGYNKLNRTSHHRKALLRGLTADLIKHERIKTTLAKAKETRIVAEKLITHGKKGTLHNRRLAMSQLPNKQIVKKVFDELAPRYAERPGGYTRVVKLGPRQGDGASMAVIELV